MLWTVDEAALVRTAGPPTWSPICPTTSARPSAGQMVDRALSAGVHDPDAVPEGSRRRRIAAAGRLRTTMAAWPSWPRRCVMQRWSRICRRGPSRRRPRSPRPSSSRRRARTGPIRDTWSRQPRTRHGGAPSGQRRKEMLRSASRPLGGEALCRSVGIDPQARAEVISVAAFLDAGRGRDLQHAIDLITSRPKPPGIRHGPGQGPAPPRPRRTSPPADPKRLRVRQKDGPHLAAVTLQQALRVRAGRTPRRKNSLT